MIRDGHPQVHSLYPDGKGRVYLAFSPTCDKQWSVAIDTFNRSTLDYGAAVFNGKYHQQFLEHEVPFTFEKRNTTSGHMVVAREHLLPTVRLLGKLDHNVLYLRRAKTDHGGFGTEYDIQRSLLQNWSKTLLSRDYEFFEEEYLVDGGRTSRRIDILARARGRPEWLVIELKRAEAKPEALEQLQDYLLAMGQRDEFNFSELSGALIAERVPQQVRRTAEQAGLHAYEIAYPIELKRVA